MAEGQFNIKQLINDSKNALLKPKEYFEQMPKDGGIVDPIIKGLIYAGVAALTGCIAIFIVTLRFPPMFPTARIIIEVLIRLAIYYAIALFLFSGITLGIAVIGKGEANYENALRVFSSTMVCLIPLSFGFIFGIFLAKWAIYLLMVISAVIIGYMFFMLYFGLTKSLGTEDKIAKIGAGVVGGICVLYLIMELSKVAVFFGMFG